MSWREPQPFVGVGLHLGQGREPTGLCVVEVQDRVGTETTPAGHHYLVRYLERLPTGTPYPTIAERLHEILAGLRSRTEEAPRVYVDATGHGEPAVKLLHAGLFDCLFWTVYFNHGDQRHREGKTIRLGKMCLVTSLLVLLQGDRLLLVQSREAEILAQELREYEVKVTPDANERYGAFRVGTQDDLVTALGLAVQIEPGGWYVG
jgi:hypothetical protein